MVTGNDFDGGGYENDYVRTDLAIERRSASGRGIDFTKEEKKGITVTRIRVTDAEGERTIGRPKGNYVTLEIGAPWLMGSAEWENASFLLA